MGVLLSLFALSAYAAEPPLPEANPARAALATRFAPREATRSKSSSFRYEKWCDQINDKISRVEFTDPKDPSVKLGNECATIADVVDYCAGRSEVVPSLTQLEASKKLISTHPTAPECASDLSAFETSKVSTGTGTPMMFGAEWQEDLVTALAAFLVRRAKAEALAWATEHLAGEMCGHKVGGTVFPGVCALLLTDESSTRSVSWGGVRQAAINDFRKLPENLLVYVIGVLPATGKAQITIRGDAALALVAATKTARAVLEGHGAAETLAGLAPYVEANTPANDPTRTLLANTLWMSGFVADQFRYDIDRQMKKCIESEGKKCKPFEASSERLRHVFNLMRKQLEPQFDSSPKLKAWFNEPNNRVELRRFVYKLQELTALATRVRLAKASDAGANETYTQFMATLAEFLGAGADLLETIDGSSPTATCDWPKKPEVAICSAVVLRSAGTMVELIDSLRRQEYSAAVARFLVLYQAIFSGSEMSSWVRDWVPFLAELAGAKDAESMEAALEAFAAPVGSYRVKRGNTNCLGDKNSGEKACANKFKPRPRRRNLHATLNAYVGLAGGAEVLLEAGGWGAHVGPTASVGFEVGWGLGPSSSFSFYIPLLDVGSLVDFRIGGNGEGSSLDSSTESVTTTPQLGVAQVISPGLFAVFGLGDSPFALGVGTQIAPELRKTTSSLGADASGRFSVVQFSVFFAADIPVWIIR